MWLKTSDVKLLLTNILILGDSFQERKSPQRVINNWRLFTKMDKCISNPLQNVRILVLIVLQNGTKHLGFIVQSTLKLIHTELLKCCNAVTLYTTLHSYLSGTMYMLMI